VLRDDKERRNARRYDLALRRARSRRVTGRRKAPPKGRARSAPGTHGSTRRGGATADAEGFPVSRGSYLRAPGWLA
jgi:hypothetical protein